MYSSYSYRSADSMTWIPIVAIILAIAATVLAFIFIMPKSKIKNLNKFWLFIHKLFHFDFLLIDKILKALYIFVTCFAILAGFFMLFVDFLTGLLAMLVLPVAIRLVYEGIMMFITLVNNVERIKNRVYDEEPQPAILRSTNTPKVFVYCPICGTRFNQEDGRCPSCKHPAYQHTPAPGASQPAAPVLDPNLPDATEHRRYQRPNL